MMMSRDKVFLEFTQTLRRLNGNGSSRANNGHQNGYRQGQN